MRTKRWKEVEGAERRRRKKKKTKKKKNNKEERNKEKKIEKESIRGRIIISRSRSDFFGELSGSDKTDF